MAEKNRTRNTNQGLKLHLLVEPDDGSIDYINITDMNVNDITDAQNMELKSERIYVFDKAAGQPFQWPPQRLAGDPENRPF